MGYKLTSTMTITYTVTLNMDDAFKAVSSLRDNKCCGDCDRIANAILSQLNDSNMSISRSSV